MSSSQCTFGLTQDRFEFHSGSFQVQFGVDSGSFRCRFGAIVAAIAVVDSFLWYSQILNN